VSASAAGTFLVGGSGTPLVQAVSLGALFLLTALPSGFVWLAFGATVQHLLHERRRLRIFNVAMAALLALSIGLIVR
jgi:threonine/homoserine/homoserine lactone efflux protein